LKGAVPLLLAGYPALDGLSEATATESIVLVATAASIVVQGATLRFFAARVSAPETVSTDAGIVPERAKAGG
jgi:NhaP-type Na+/H+ and K+/H+ antiporter